jgi:hypothetical protein
MDQIGWRRVVCAPAGSNAVEWGCGHRSATGRHDQQRREGPVRGSHTRGRRYGNQQYFSRIFGRHSIKIGAEYRWYTSANDLLQNSRGIYYYTNLTNLLLDQVPAKDQLQGIGSSVTSLNARNPVAAEDSLLLDIPMGIKGGFPNAITSMQPAGASEYHGGAIDLNRRFASGLHFRAYYTWAKAMDNSTNDLFTSVVNPRRPQDPANLRDEWSRSTLDVRHKVGLMWTYDLPKLATGSGLLDRLLQGWQWAGDLPLPVWPAGYDPVRRGQQRQQRQRG